MIEQYSTMTALAGHPWLVGGVTLLVIILLLVPFELVNDTRSGFRRRSIHALLWRWEQQPGYSRLYLHGLLRLQQAILRGLDWLWDKVRSHFLAGIIDMLRRWLG